jgi:hypothetical protein
VNAAALKRCYVCGRLQPLGDFYKRSASRDGRQAMCKDCDRARQSGPYLVRRRELDALRKRQERETETPEDRSARLAARRESMESESVEQRERRLAYFREYRRRKKAMRSAA